MSVRGRKVQNKLAAALERERTSHGMTKIALDLANHLHRQTMVDRDRCKAAAEMNAATVAEQQLELRALERRAFLAERRTDILRHQARRCVRLMRAVRDGR